MKELVIILDNIRSALNVGSVFRTSDGAGVIKIILCGITPYPPHKGIKKTSIGADENVKWEYKKEVKDAILELKDQGYKIISAELTPKSVSYTDVTYPQKTAIILGHEITGVSNEALELSDAVISLPMIGKKTSLNVSITAGIIIYHINFGSK